MGGIATTAGYTNNYARGGIFFRKFDFYINCMYNKKVLDNLYNRFTNSLKAALRESDIAIKSENEFKG